MPSSILENKFKTIEKRVFDIPADLGGKLETHTSNGKSATIQAKSRILLLRTQLLFASHISSLIWRVRSTQIKSFKTKNSLMGKIHWDRKLIRKKLNGRGPVNS